jgi:hypothetical protein
MKQLQLLLHDRRRRQRGSVLSAVLIIVAFLSILIGALLTELTDSFLVSRDLVSRVNTEATVTSSVELAIHQLQGGPVPAVCAKDARGPWFVVNLNGHNAAVTQTCQAIVPEDNQRLAGGFFTVDGIHDTVGGNRYLVGDATGRLAAYPIGQSNASWSVGLGGALTAPPTTAADPNGSVDILVPVAKSADGCGGHCVVLYSEGSGAPALRCTFAASNTVGTGAAAEAVPAGFNANFAGYAFFGDASGTLYVYDGTSNGCPRQVQATISGRLAGAPLVYPDKTPNNGNTVSDELFVLVTSSSGTSLQHWRYTETKGCSDGGDCDNQQAPTLTQVSSQSLNGTNAVGYDTSAAAPTPGTPLGLAVATASGRLDVARITVDSRANYGMTSVASAMLPNGSVAARAPNWCHCPGQDLIGVGSTNGFLYLYTNGLNLAYSYDGQPDGRPAINSTPTADSNGDWYFGASDGSVYDVEIPMTGTQLFKAARFGPGPSASITSSPIATSCPNGPCLYFGSSNAGSWYYRIGSTRVSDLRACVSTAAGSTTCADNPRLWARVLVPGPAGGTQVLVQGWSFYSP